MQSAGRFFDGNAGLRLDVALQIDAVAETLRLSHPDLPKGAQYWPFDAIRALADQARTDQLVLSLRSDTAADSGLITTARLTVDDAEMVSVLTRLCPDLHRADVPDGTARKVALRVGAAVAALALMIFVIVPALAGTLAGLIPVEREVAWGKTVVRQIERFLGGSSAGQLVCTEADGQAALTAMTERLTAAADLDYALDVTVFDHKMVNAFAAPGGQIVLMRGLITEATHPDQVAAVLAHEIGHVEARDTTRGALRAAGSVGLLSLVLGDFAGGSVAIAVAEHTLTAAYTREAEAAADAFALDMMARAGADAEAMATFFDRLGETTGGMPALPEYFATHPPTADRAASARAFAQDQGVTQAILSNAEWDALRGVCG